MKYEHLTTDQQAQLIEQRLANYEREHFEHGLNLAALEASGATDPDTMTAADNARQAMAVLDAAHATATAELAKVRKRR